jgi:hypothetical protein
LPYRASRSLPPSLRGAKATKQSRVLLSLDWIASLSLAMTAGAVFVLHVSRLAVRLLPARLLIDDAVSLMPKHPEHRGLRGSASRPDFRSNEVFAGKSIRFPILFQIVRVAQTKSSASFN